METMETYPVRHKTKTDYNEVINNPEGLLVFLKERTIKGRETEAQNIQVRVNKWGNQHGYKFKTERHADKNGKLCAVWVYNTAFDEGCYVNNYNSK